MCAIYVDKDIAILFVLCETRTQLVYKSIWKKIIKLAPDLQCDLRFIMMDYEKASMNAVHMNNFLTHLYEAIGFNIFLFVKYMRDT